MIRVSNITKIQEIRAVQALSDLNIEIHIDKNEESKFYLLNKYFKMSYLISNQKDHINYQEIIKINHSEPSTTILSVSKPLIYSKSIPLFLKNKWPGERNYKFSFCGLITNKRRITIQNWINTAREKKIELKTDNFFQKIKKKINYYINIQCMVTQRYGDLHIWTSNRGRVFPIKSWDMNYYDFLLKSEFILCPSGDYIWTYRFFEAIMCGAIPVVEETCESYDGFKFYMMNDKRNKIRYDKEIVDYNFKLLIERITIDQAESEVIKNEIMQLTIKHK